MTEPPPVRVRFAYEESEFVAAMRLYLARKLKPRRFVPLAVSILVLSALLAWRDVGTAVAVFGGVAALALLGIEAIAFWVWPRRVFRSEPSFLDTFELRFDESGIEVITGGDTIELDWSSYVGQLEDERVLVLVSEDMFTAIPKRAFEDEGDERRVRQLVSDSLQEPS